METAAADKGAEFHDRLVAIDLGERGIGYAVFDIPKALEEECDDDPLKIRPLKTGTVAVSSIRALIRAVGRHRGRAQPMQKVRDAHSRALEKRRKNVIGDVCHEIDSLCAQWRAFPVLEDGVQNLESGGQQLKLVYGSVLHRYARVDNVEAHQKARREHWFTGTAGEARRKKPVEAEWPHPYLTDQNGRSTTLYPGQAVPAAGTSQQCSVCGRNAIRLLREKPNLRLTFRNGEADLTDGAALFLYEKAEWDSAQRRQFRRRKIRPALNRPLNGVRRADELSALVKRNLRRPPESTRSPDTAQSRYHCVFVGCRAELHADINAAVNIGRKLLGKMSREKSRKKFAERAAKR